MTLEQVPEKPDVLVPDFRPELSAIHSIHTGADRVAWSGICNHGVDDSPHFGYLGRHIASTNWYIVVFTFIS